MENYFFIPADKEKFILKAAEINADNYVFDLEDAVSKANKDKAYKNLLNLSFRPNYWVRIPNGENDYTSKQLTHIISKFNGQIVLPKVESNADIEALLLLAQKISQSIRLILLIESPKGLLQTSEFLQSYANIIHGVSLGTHDFCTSMGMKHSDEHIIPYKKQIILLAKSFGTKYIDGVNTQINDTENLKKEVVFASDAGADGKFLIHPNQLKAFKTISFFTKEELEDMAQIIEHYNKIGSQNMDIFIFKGRIYEKPHIQGIKNILMNNSINK
jgi:citrate lyase subunit beta/citryl-CoA lyase